MKLGIIILYFEKNAWVLIAMKLPKQTSLKKKILKKSLWKYCWKYMKNLKKSIDQVNNKMLLVEYAFYIKSLYLCICSFTCVYIKYVVSMVSKKVCTLSDKLILMVSYLNSRWRTSHGIFSKNYILIFIQGI